MTRDNTPCEAADARECCEIGSEFGMVRSILGKDARVAKQSTNQARKQANQSKQSEHARKHGSRQAAHRYD
jgi:hypothetical protein